MMKNAKDDKKKTRISNKEAMPGYLKRLLCEASQVREVVGITQNLLSQWIGRGYVKPLIAATGQGTRNYFNVNNICQILLFKELNEAGFNRTESSKLAFQPAMGKIFAFTLKRLSEDYREGKLNALGPFDRNWINAFFFRKEGGETEVIYVIEKSDFNDALIFKLGQSRLTFVANLSRIASEVYLKL